jgi:CBS domain containing-hemolysin-like protein
MALSVHRRLSYHLSGAQLGLTVVSLLLGFVAEPTIAQAIEPALDGFLSESTARGVSVAIALALATVLSMVLGELIPKNIVLAAPDRAAVRLAGPLHLFSVALSPLIKVSNGVANRLVRLLGVEPTEELQSARTIDDLAGLIRSSSEEGTLAGDRATLLDRSIRFSDKTVADALVPRVQVEALEADQLLPDLVEAAVRTGHSRFPVVEEDLDDVVGVVHVKDVFGVPAAERAATPVRSLMTEPVAVPETRTLGGLFADLRQGGRQLAIVVDEHGGLAGIVTLEDLLEEIVGEIDDEYDPPTTAARFDPASGDALLAGALHEDEVRQACGFRMPDGEYDTLAGFVIDRLGHLPVVGEAVSENGWRFEVADMDRHRIALVRVTAPPRPDTGPEPEPGEGRP